MRTLKDIRQIAIEHQWTLNPSTKSVENVIKGQNKLKQNFGEFYCPCKPDHDAANICPCQNAEKEIARTGHCHCNLFFKKKEA